MKLIVNWVENHLTQSVEQAEELLRRLLHRPSRSEIEEWNGYRERTLNRFNEVVLPLSMRIVNVRTALNHLRPTRPYTELEQAIEAACDEFDGYFLDFTNILSGPTYLVKGDEVSQAKRLLDKCVNEAEKLLLMLQNRNQIRRELTYDE